MRVLAWPLYTYAGNLNADSGYICFRNLIRAIPEWTWHVLVPDWATDENGKRVHDDLDDLPNVVKVPVPMHTLYRGQEVLLDPETVWKYSPQVGTQPLDAVITGSNQIAATLANAWGIRMEDDNRPLIVAWDLMTRDDRNRGWNAQDVELLLHFAGAVVADLNVYGSEMMRWMTADMLRKQFAPAVVREVLANRSETIYAGVPVARIDEVTAGIPKRDKFTVFYGGRMGGVKRVDELTEIADLAFSFGRDIEMVVCTGSFAGPRRVAFQKQFPMVELHVGTGQEETWRLMAQCHAGFMWSRHEMIGSMFIEEMAHGLPVIAVPHRWINALLPEEYPYWAHDVREGGAHLRLLYDAWKADPDGYDDPMKPWQAHVRERWDSVDASQKMRGVVEGRVNGMRASVTASWDRGAGESILEVVGQVLVDGMTFPDLVEAIQEAARKRSFLGQRLTQARSHPLLEAYHAAQYLGWKDVGTDVPVFTKETV